jgi:hypothetical protein
MAVEEYDDTPFLSRRGPQAKSSTLQACYPHAQTSSQGHYVQYNHQRDNTVSCDDYGMAFVHGAQKKSSMQCNVTRHTTAKHNRAVLMPRNVTNY